MSGFRLSDPGGRGQTPGDAPSAGKPVLRLEKNPILKYIIVYACNIRKYTSKGFLLGVWGVVFAWMARGGVWLGCWGADEQFMSGTQTPAGLTLSCLICSTALAVAPPGALRPVRFLLTRNSVILLDALSPLVSHIQQSAHSRQQGWQVPAGPSVRHHIRSRS